MIPGTGDPLKRERAVRAVVSSTLEQSERLRRACALLAETLDRDQILGRLVEMVDQLVELERIFVVLTDDAGSRVWADFLPPSGAAATIGPGDPHPNLLVGSFEESPSVCPGTIAVGLTVSGRDLGFVGLLPAPHRLLDVEDRHRLSVLARQAAVSLFNASMIEQATALGALQERHRIAVELRHGLLADLADAERITQRLADEADLSSTHANQLGTLDEVIGKARMQAMSLVRSLLSSSLQTSGPIATRTAHPPQHASERKSDILVDLTSREHEVVDLVAMGLSNGDIGRRLDLSVNTVKNHVSRSMGKYGVRSRTELAALLLGERNA